MTQSDIAENRNFLANFS